MVMDLSKGFDFRLPEYRREVFLRFFEFHLKYRSHPGSIYYLMPYLSEKEDWDKEQKLWFAYLNGNTQNPVTSYILIKRFPHLSELNLTELRDWFHGSKVYQNLQWDTDRRYHKKSFIENVENYRQIVGNSQVDYFAQFERYSETANFMPLWNAIRDGFLSFGRLSAFSYMEYLRIMGVKVDCDRLFLDDMQGSMSHRNGLAKVLGRDDWDWHKSNPYFTGKYTDSDLAYLTQEGSSLLQEAKQRAVGKDWAFDTNYFTMESALCTYKSWHRPNRRYPNVYNDMLATRIKWAEERWLRPKLGIFWEARKEMLPSNLRIEDNPMDVGCKPLKQNHYRLTGEVIMMERDWSCFENEYAKKRITA